jgi:hypothetical protein
VEGKINKRKKKEKEKEKETKQRNTPNSTQLTSWPLTKIFTVTPKTIAPN